MVVKGSLNKIYAPSTDVVARDIQGEFVLVPVVSGIGDLEDEIFTLNETGRAIWNSLDGKNSLKAVAEKLALEYQAPFKKIEADVMGLTAELLKRKMLVEVRR